MRKSIISAVFAALICAGWMMAIPVGPIPIVLQNALAVLAGLLLGPLFGYQCVVDFRHCVFGEFDIDDRADDLNYFTGTHLYLFSIQSVLVRRRLRR